MEQTLPRAPYPTGVTAEEWAFLAPDPAWMTRDAPHRAACGRCSTPGAGPCGRGGARRRLPTHVPPRPVVDRQPRRWIEAGGAAVGVRQPDAADDAAADGCGWR